MIALSLKHFSVTLRMIFSLVLPVTEVRGKELSDIIGFEYFRLIVYPCLASLETGWRDKL